MSHAIIMQCYKYASHVSIIIFFSAQAPGDEASRCNETFYVHTYPDSVKILMDNWNYEQLLPGSGSGSNPIAGAVWRDVSCDSNDVTSIINPSYVSHLMYIHEQFMYFCS